MKKITMMLAAMLSVVYVSAATVTIDVTSGSFPFSKNGVTISADKAGGQSAPVVKEDRNESRLYSKNTMTVSIANGEMTSIAITRTHTEASDSKTEATLSANVGTIKDDVWTGKAAEVVFTVSEVSKGQYRFSQVQVATEGEELSVDAGDDEGDDEEDYGELTFDFEPTTKTNFNVEIDEAAFELTDEGVVLIYLENDELEIELAIVTDEEGMPVGTFQVSDSEENGTVLASPGGDDYSDYPSCMITDYDDEGNYTAAYYFASGTIKIEETADGYSIELDVVTVNGSTIKTTYSGEVEDVTDYDEYEAGQSDALTTVKAELDLNAPIYNALGQKINAAYKGVVIQNGHKFIRR